jgi:hypothetical protein
MQKNQVQQIMQELANMMARQQTQNDKMDVVLVVEHVENVEIDDDQHDAISGEVEKRENQHSLLDLEKEHHVELGISLSMSSSSSTTTLTLQQRPKKKTPDNSTLEFNSQKQNGKKLPLFKTLPKLKLYNNFNFAWCVQILRQLPP